MAFQSTLPYGRDFTCSHFSSDAVLFQSTLPYGSDFLIASPALPMPDFNPHSLTGATISRTSLFSLAEAFQSTLPYGSDTWRIDAIPWSETFQFSLSAWGAIRRQEQAVTFMSISIHAPSRERLPPLYPPQDCSLISIHAPSRERRLMMP